MATTRHPAVLTGLAGLTLVTVACGGPTPAEDVAPQLAEICEDIEIDLTRLPAQRSDPVTTDDIDEMGDAFWAAMNALPDVDTTAGRPRSVLGGPIQQARRTLSRLTTMYNERDVSVDTSELQEQMNTALTELEAAAVEFGLDSCVDVELADGEFAILVAGLDPVLDAIRPTGDFGTDFAAACVRFRNDIADLLLSQVGDPTAQVTAPFRVAGVMERFATDLGNLTVPDDRRERFDELLTALDEAASAADRIQQAQITSQEALDAAVFEFEQAEQVVNGLVAEFDAEC